MHKHNALSWTFHTDYFPFPWQMLLEAMGLIPGFLDPRDPRPAIEQFKQHHPALWEHSSRYPGTLVDGLYFKYPGDPLMKPIAHVQFHDDLVLVYQYGIVIVRHADHTFQIARLD